MEIEVESKRYLEIEYITDIGHDEVTLEQKERMLRAEREEKEMTMQMLKEKQNMLDR